MTSALLINASPLGARARGYQLALQAAARLRHRHGGLDLVIRDLAATPPGAVSAAYADAILGRAPPEAPAFAESEQLIREVEAAAHLIISTPMHNYTVPAALKLWIDHVLRIGRSFASREGLKIGLLADRPTLVIVASGGAVRGPAALQPDHLTGYLTDVLATIGIRDVRFVHLEALARPELARQAMAEGAEAILRDNHFGDVLAA